MTRLFLLVVSLVEGEARGDGRDHGHQLGLPELSDEVDVVAVGDLLVLVGLLLGEQLLMDLR